jgi:hypothetical protein
MKTKLLLASIAVLLAGCVVAPVPQGHVVIQPSVEFVYIWDPIRAQYYYVQRGYRYYRPRGWQYPHGDGYGHRH